VQKSQKNSRFTASSGVRTRQQVISQPEVVSADVLGTMLDEDLIVRLRVLDEACRTATSSGIDTRPWEEEIAYVKREQHLRRARREQHLIYARKIEQEFNDSERGLPAGDFDNSAFVYAASGGRPRWN